MTKRERVKIKFGGMCAYTGKPLDDKWQVDHIIPVSNYKHSLKQKNHIDNLVPTIRIVNHYKRGKDLELWRTFLLKMHTRLAKLPISTQRSETIKRKRYLLEVAEHFGITKDKPFNGIFYFETLNK